MNCPICSSSRISASGEVGRFSFFRCRSCAAGFLHPQPDDAFLDKLYSESYYDSWGLNDETKASGTRAMKQATFDLYLRKIRRFKSGGRILDIGCATGFFLERARAAGFDCYGVEVSGYSSAVARAALGQERIFTGVVETCPFAGASFDVITMFDLFEHVRDPLNTLCAAHRLLRDDGIVVIMTPDIESPTARLMGKTWTHFKPEHLFYFGPRSMLPAAAKTGFRIIHQAGAPKVITADYALSQFMAYPHRLITPFMKTMAAVLPERLMRKQLGVTMGERIFIMTKA